MTELLFNHTASNADGIWYSWKESSVVHLTLWYQMTHTGVYFWMMQLIMAIIVHPLWGLSFHICFFF